ncbi:transposon I factor [Aspergillus luchuensis]|uniref:Transposon I factor n=1 Tax=Aspergillus kawachii TaxID=1069201 RepID=A0A146EYU2_ASPKA|nr:transposon I factor [Aspergillus luchuensis]
MGLEPAKITRRDWCHFPDASAYYLWEFRFACLILVDNYPLTA